MHLVLRDGAEVEGGIFLNDGQALAPYLGTRKGGWVNLVGATWLVPIEETVSHAVLQADHVMYAYGVDGDVPVHSVQAGNVALRAIEITLTNDARIRGDLAIANRQRLSDFLHTAGKFIPVVGVSRVDSGKSVGDIALNHAAVRVLRDAAVNGRPAQPPDAVRATPHAGMPAIREPVTGARPLPKRAGPVPDDRAPLVEAPSARPIEELPSARPIEETASARPTVTKTTIKGPVAEFVLETSVPVRAERREAVRPNFRLNLDDETRPPIEVTEPEEAATPYSPAVNAIAERAAQHWLSLVADRFGLSHADPRKLRQAYTSEDLWTGIARANDLSVDELALHVATTFRLQVARLDELEASAVGLLKEEIARQLLVCPVRADASTIVIACADPTNAETRAALGAATQRMIEFEIAAPTAIRGAIDWWYRAFSSRVTTPTSPLPEPPAS
ncbi:MAG: hypothetical protein K8S21_02845 [Gemmatimonadetes bacterium]|nr:hypothetical protein [Gemmatimonadota bacterium]